MKAAIRPTRAPSRPICQLCDYISHQPGYRRAFAAARAPKTPLIRRPQPTRQHGAFTTIPRRQFWSATKLQEQDIEIEHPQETAGRAVSLNAQLRRVEEHINIIFDSPKVESEDMTLEALDALDSIARQAIKIRSGQPQRAKLNLRQSSAGAILSLDGDEPPPTNKSKAKNRSSKSTTTDELPSPNYLSTLATNLLKHEKVFISPRILSAYVDLQDLLGRPGAIPEILYLYATKPIPELDSSPPKYSKPSPKSHKQAVPTDIAERALTAAIDAKDMPLALNIIDLTYRAPAWRRHMFVRKVFPPGMAIAALPLLLYMIANETAIYSGYIDPSTFKMYSFAGLLTYVTCTGTLGFVALTTHNDHHDRIVWRPGVPLFDRWIREGERAALDRIACAWGFKEHWKRGDEEGEEWEGLRQLALMRGMVLDKTDLMPGMNA